MKLLRWSRRRPAAGPVILTERPVAPVIAPLPRSEGAGAVTGAGAALSPSQPRVWLGFVDGSRCELDPWSRDARALLAVARGLAAAG
jgi:hypothetical protein